MKVVLACLVVVSLCALNVVGSEKSQSGYRLVYSNPTASNRTISDVSALAGEADWTQHQYNAQHTGHNDKSTISLPLELKWDRSDIWPPPYHTATVVGDRILLTHGRGEGEARITCLDANDGSILWTGTFGVVHSVSQASAAYDLVYVHVFNWRDSYMAAIDLYTGQLVADVNLQHQSDIYLAPTVFDGALFFGTGLFGGLGSYDAYSLEARWWIRAPQVDFWTPAVYDSAVYVYLGYVVVAFDINSGDELWRVPTYNPQSSNTFAEDCTPPSMGASPVIDSLQNIIYLMWHQVLHAVDMDAKEILWFDSGYFKVPDSAYYNFRVSLTPVLYDGNVFVIESGRLLAYDGLTGDRIWEFAGENQFVWTPVAANGYLFVASTTSTIALNLTTREPEWSWPMGGKLSVAGNRLYVSHHEGHLLVFDGITTSVTDSDNSESSELPHSFALYNNYPNPFNPSTDITFGLPYRCQVKLTVLNSLGQIVKTLVNDSKSAGSHSVTWDGQDESGIRVSSGVYFYRLEADRFIETKKMVLLK